MSLKVEDWGFALDLRGDLVIGGMAAQELARKHGTPVHVLDERGLRARARLYRRSFEAAYDEQVSAYYALKCNNVPGVVDIVLSEGFQPEVCTPYEWELAKQLGFDSRHVIVNGPNKGPLLETAISGGAGLIVIDGPQELAVAEEIARRQGVRVRVLLRVNPDCVPRGMNRASATGSRRLSVFGFDLHSGEVHATLDRLARGSPAEFRGFHTHVGTGIRRAEDYVRPMGLMADCLLEARKRNLEASTLDIGGGFGVPTSRELNTREFLIYQAAGRLPPPPDPAGFPGPEVFAGVIAATLQKECGRRGVPLPQLVLEPGRAIVSGADVLLVTVGAVKPRDGVGTWVVTDGGAGTVAFPLFYEYHEVFRCRDAHADRTERYTLVGGGCFSADWIYRNKRMPTLVEGDVLAICDAGAYFTAQESNFGFPHPPIVAVTDGRTRLLRRRETFDDMVSRDMGWNHAAANCCAGG